MPPLHPSMVKRMMSSWLCLEISPVLLPGLAMKLKGMNHQD
jgi:hypothetical protein